jgi:hypothetical protein
MAELPVLFKRLRAETIPDEAAAIVAAPSATRAMVSGPALIQWVLLSRMALAAIWPRTGPASVQSDRFITNDCRSVIRRHLLANEENGEHRFADIPIRS